MKKSISIILVCIGLTVSSLQAMKSGSNNTKQESILEGLLIESDLHLLRDLVLPYCDDGTIMNLRMVSSRLKELADEMLPVHRLIQAVTSNSLREVQEIAQLPLSVRRRLASNKGVHEVIKFNADWGGIVDKKRGILFCLLENIVDDSPYEYMNRVLTSCVDDLLCAAANKIEEIKCEEELDYVIKYIEKHKEKYIGHEKSIRETLYRWNLDHSISRDTVEKINKKLYGLAKKIEDAKKLQQVIKDLEELDIT